MSIPPHFIENLLQRLDIVDVVDSYVPLKKFGKTYKALCPFHHEKTPSFTVDQSRQFYYCFGCGAKGNLIGFLMAYLNLDFINTIEELADRLGLEIPREGGKPTKDVLPKSDLYELSKQASQFYQAQLQAPQSAHALAYLKQRGLSDEIIERYEIGYAPAGWDNLISKLGGNSNERLDRLLSVGLVVKKDQGNGYYDRFRDRIMFPIFDPRGRVIAFGGRKFSETEQNSPKYLNSPETPIYSKGKELYGLYHCKKNKPEQLHVVEGYMDVLALVQHGVPNVVATLGTAVTDGHMQRLFRSTSTIVLCFDGDSAGKKAAHKAMEIALPSLHEGRRLFFCFMPDGEDPDSCIRKQGKELFLNCDTWVPLSEHLLEEVSEGLSLALAEDKGQLAYRATPYIKKMPQSILRQLLVDKIAALTNRPISEIEARGRSQSTSQQDIKTSPPFSVAEARCVSAVLQFPSLLAESVIQQKLVAVELEQWQFLGKLVQIVTSQSHITTGGIIEHWRGTEYETVLQSLVKSTSPYQDDEYLYSEQAVRDTLLVALDKLIELGKRTKLRQLSNVKSVRDLTDEQWILLSGLVDGTPDKREGNSDNDKQH